MLFWFKTIYNAQLKRISIGVMLAFFAAFSGVSLLLLSGWFVTATALAGISISMGIVIAFDMYMPGSGIRFFALSRTVGRYVERLYNHDTILRLVAVFRLTLFMRLSRLNVDQLRKTSDSEWLSRLTADLDSLDSLLLRFTITPIVLVLSIFCSTVFIHFVWPEYTLMIGSYMLATGISVTLITIKTTKGLSFKNARLLNEMRSNVIEHLQGRFELTSTMLMQRHERHIIASLTSLDAVQTSINNRIANIQLVLDLVLMIGICSLAIIALLSVNIGQIDGPVAVMAVLMFVAISELLQVLPAHFKQWGGTSYSANRISPQLNDRANSSDASIELNDSDVISVTIKKHPNITTTQTSTLSIEIADKQTLVISGQSGAGKSTVANIISGVTSRLNSVDSDISILVSRDHQSRKNPPHFSWAKLGYLTQSNSILAGTLAYNLRLGIENVTEPQLWEVLRRVELDKWAEQLSEGLYSWLGDTGNRVSGGQSRRIALARLLLRSPDLVILDEPFIGLDKKMAERIWLNINDWLAERKVVLLAHEFPKNLLAETDINHIRLSE